MSGNDKISINVEINAEGKQQINQYSSAFDGLRKSISDLSKPINDINRNLTDVASAISKLNEQNNAASSTIAKVGGAFSNGINIFDIVQRALVTLRIQSAALTGALTGGLSVILAFLPELIEITKGFFKGSEATGQWVQRLKDVNSVMKDSNTGAAEQTAKLNVLYKAVTGVNTAGQERIKHAKQLIFYYI